MAGTKTKKAGGGRSKRGREEEDNQLSPRTKNR